MKKKHYLPLLMRLPDTAAGIFVFLIVLSVVFLMFSRYSADLTAMLPEKSSSARVWKHIENSGMFNKTVLFFDSGKNIVPQIPALERIAGKLENVQHVRQVDFRYMPEDSLSAVRNLIPYLPQLISPDLMLKEAPEKAADRFYRKLMTGAPGMIPLLTADPLGLSAGLLKKANRMRELSGIRLNSLSPYFVSEDNRYAMMVVHTDLSAANAPEAKKLLAEMKRISSVPGIKVRMVSALCHTVENQHVIKRDINIMFVASLLVFFLLFIWAYRCDFRTLLIPLIPIGASVIVLGFQAFVRKECLLFVIGMGGIVVGLAVDYGIHIYGAVRKGRFALRRMPYLFYTLLAGSVTSGGAFALFMLSGARGLRQLGFFAGGSLLLSMFAFYYLLPPLFSSGKKEIPGEHALPAAPQKHAWLFLSVWLIFFILTGMVLFPYGKIHSDIRSLDVSSKNLSRTEGLYRKVFSTGHSPAVILLEGRSTDELLRKSEICAKNLRSFGVTACFAPADLYPSSRTRSMNVRSWQKRTADFNRFEKSFMRRCIQLGIKEEPLEKYFADLKKGILVPQEKCPQLFLRIMEQCVTDNYAAVYFPDHPGKVRIAEMLYPGCVLSQSGFAPMIGRDLFDDLILPLIFAILLVLAVTFMYFRNIHDTICALAPPAVSLLTVSTIFVLKDGGVNFAVLIAMTVLVGISVDYGIFVTSALRRKQLFGGVFDSVTLSALTTMGGGAAVVFAGHPILHSAGLAILCGAFSAWLAGMFLTPALFSVCPKKRISAIVLLLTVLISGCHSSPFPEPVYEPVRSAEMAADKLYGIRSEFPRSYLTEAGIVVEYGFFRTSVLSAARVNLMNGSVSVVMMNPAGAKFFEARGISDKASYYYWFPGSPWAKYENTAADTAVQDLSFIMLNLIPPDKTPFKLENGRLIFEQKNADGSLTRWNYAGIPLQLAEKTLFRRRQPLKQLKIYRCISTNALLYPGDMIFENHEKNYRLIIRTRKIEVTR